MSEKLTITAADVGFADDREFLGYVAAHSRTERALFNNKQIAFALQLAGQPAGRVQEWWAAEGLWRSVDMSDLVELARARSAASPSGGPTNPLNERES